MELTGNREQYVLKFKRGRTSLMKRTAHIPPHAVHGTNWKARLKLVGAGAVCIAFGWLRIWAGVQVVSNAHRQPVFSYGLVALGIVLILFAAIPDKLIARAVAVKKR